MTDQPLTVRLAQSFGSKTSFKGRSLIALVDDVVEQNLDGQVASTFGEQLRCAQKAEDIHEEIKRRLALIENFHDPESVRIRAILETGEDKPWFA